MASGGRAVTVEKISSSAREGIEATVLCNFSRKPSLDAQEVRVQVRSASLNFPELLLMQNKYQMKPKLPFVLCMEGAGVITEVGEKVRGFKPGDHVFYSWQGAACDELVIPQQACYKLPLSYSFSEGAGFYLGYTTAYHALVHRGRLQENEWLLVTGAGGGMGLMAVQMGKAVGARVIAAASSDEKLEVCRKLGADYVVNYSKQSLKDAVGDITNNKFCDVIYEPVGGEIFNQCVRCVAPRGYARLLVIGFASGTIPQFPINMALIKGFDLVGVRMGAQMMVQPDVHREMMKHLLNLANEGKLRPYISAEFPVERYKDAFYLIEERKVIGKCCLTFGHSKL